MFIGHLALGFAAKRVAPSISLAVLLLAAQLADTLWPVLVALGVERVLIEPGNTEVTPLNFVSYPYSHSLLLLALWGVVMGWVYRKWTNNKRGLAVLWGLVVSHWVLDFVSHRPDMPLYPAGPTLGLGLWNSRSATLATELVLFTAGVWSYLRCTRARDSIGRWACFSLVAFLVAAYIANSFGPPPPSVAAIWITGLLGGLLLLSWSAWADGHRSPL